MTAPSFKIRRVIVAVLLLGLGAVATVNFLLRRELPVEFGRAGNRVVIERVDAGSEAERAGVRVGDALLQMNGETIRDAGHAEWEVLRLQPGDRVTFRLLRGSLPYDVTLHADRPFPLGYLLLDRLTGFAFLLLGLLVWWPGSNDPTARAFFRLNAIGGIAILFYGYESFFGVSWISHVYALIWLATYALLPPAMTDFLFRFPRRIETHRAVMVRQVVLYAPFVLMLVGLAVTYFIAQRTDDVIWITRYDQLFRHAFGPLLVVYFVLSLVRLVYLALNGRNAWEARRNRWLLLCTILGIVPFIFLQKLPTLWGWPALLPRGTAISFLLIAPVGWGMAVTSFHLLKVEWTLSRTIVYLIAGGIVLYSATALIVVGVGYLERGDSASLILLLLFAALLIGLALLGLVGRVKWLVDRVYYGDWFSTEQAVQDLSARLSSCLRESDVIEILTSELPAVLSLKSAALLVRAPDGRLTSPAQTTLMIGSDIRDLLSSDLPRELPKDVRNLLPDQPLYAHGFRAAVPLVHQDIILGWLLLGAKHSAAPFSERDRQLLGALSSFAGMALSNTELSRRLLEQERRAVVVDLAGGIAHEINNTLSPLMGQAQLIRLTAERNPQGVSAEGVADSAHIISDMCGRIKRIAENLNRLAKPTPLKTAPLSLNAVAEDAIQIMTETAGRIKRFQLDDPQAPFQLRKELDPKLPTVLGDADQLSQVYINLIMNAADVIAEQGRGVLTVGTRFLPDLNCVCGYVADTGPGVPHDLLDKIFQPYFTTKAEGKGTGLGLAIVRSILEAHGGSIKVKSVPGAGALFEFSLPLPAS
jgi:signal transduction histidine kinase